MWLPRLGHTNAAHFCQFSWDTSSWNPDTVVLGNKKNSCVSVLADSSLRTEKKLKRMLLGIGEKDLFLIVVESCPQSHLQ